MRDDVKKLCAKPDCNLPYRGIGAFISYLMAYRNISSSEMARYLNVCESTFYKRIKNNPGKITIDEIHRISELSGVEIADILGNCIMKRQKSPLDT